MSRLTCTFCAHRNPEGSRFCNRCGSPLHLVPCAQCEAINNASDTHCYACGAPLSEGSTEALAPAGYVEERQEGGVTLGEATAVEAAIGGEAVGGEAVGGESVGGAPAITLADHLEDIPWDIPMRASASVEPHSAARSAEREPGDDAHRHDDVEARDAAIAATPVHWVDYATPSRRWPQRIALAVAFVAIAGVVYWSTLAPRDDGQPVRQARPTTNSQPVARPEIAPTPSVPASEPTVSAPASQSVTSAPESASTGPAATPQSAAGPAAPEPAASATAVPASAATEPAAPEPATPEPSAATDKPAAGTGATSRASGETRRASTSATRTREQALRDAEATRRLIERDLVNAPRPDSRTAPPPP